MKIRRRYLIFGVVSVFLLVALLIWRENRNFYRAPGGDTYSRMRQAIMSLPLATNNTSEFERVPNLTLENWAE